MTYEINATTLYTINAFDVNSFDFPEANPFDDNGGETDGPGCYLEVASVSEGDYGEFAPEGYFFGPETEGYRLDGYTSEMRGAFEAADIRRWMGNDSQQFALFLANEKQLAALEATLDEME